MDNSGPVDDSPMTTAVREMRRWRIVPSRSAVLVALILMIPWVLITVPGHYPYSPPYSRSQEKQTGLWVYGWPLVHLCTWRADAPEKVGPGIEPIEDRMRGDFESITQQSFGLEFLFGEYRASSFWSNFENWRHDCFAGMMKWNVINLCLNLGVGMAIFVFLLAVLEYRKRKRGRMLKISILDLLVAVAILGGVLATIVHEKNGAGADWLYIKRLEQYSWNEGWTDSSSVQLPEWIDRLFDYRIESALQLIDKDASLHRVRSVRYVCHQESDPSQPVKPGEIANILNKLPRLANFAIDSCRPEDFEILNGLKSKSIRALTISIYDVESSESEFDFSFLNELPNLKSLTIGWPGDGHTADSSITKCLIRVQSIPCKLEHLDLGRYMISVSDCNWILKQRSLKRLESMRITSEAQGILTLGNPALKINSRIVPPKD